ncbi:MAG: hypothetical protein M3Z13_01845, partial [Candidatus Dormibacteraeota bacterium]|nr:hypothetical protein [Candidatus Dormibacteraeota bacterium]
MRMREHDQHIYQGEPDEDLIESLEPDQLVSAMHVAVPRRQFSRSVSAALWALRIFLLAVTAMVIYV